MTSHPSGFSRIVGELSRETPLAGPWWTPSRVTGALSAVTLGVAVSIAVLSGSSAPLPLPDGATVFAMAPSSLKSDTSASARLNAALRNELSAWSGVRVIDGVGRGDTTAYVVDPVVVRMGDSARVRVTMWRSAPDAVVPATLERVFATRALDSADGVAAALAPQVLLRSVAPALAESDVPGVQAVPNRSMPALQRYAQGFVALRAGQLDTAAARFREAARTTPNFAHAELWAAQSDAWLKPRNPEAWRGDVERSLRARSLVGADALHAQALSALSASNYEESCAAFRSLVQQDERSFVGWFGLGECQRLDRVVLPMEQGPRFRSSHWSALMAYREAIAQVQTSELLAALFPTILNTTYAESGRTRNGVSQDGRRQYSAMPSLTSDTIAFYPLDPGTFGNVPKPASWLQATRRGRAMATDLAEHWISRWNESSSAWLHYALALEMGGQLGSGESGPSAEMALARASRVASTAVERAHIAVTSARMALRRGDLAAASGISRDALREPVLGDPLVRMALAPLAVFIGDRKVALRLAVPDTGRAQEPDDVADSITSFRVRAVMHECDGLEASRSALETMFGAKYSGVELGERRKQLLHQPYREAAPCLGPALASEFLPERALDSVYISLAAGHRLAALQQLRGLQARRRSATASTMTWDVIYAESWALVAAGDSSGAAKQLRGALGDISSMSSFTLLQTAQAGGLRQGIALARQLAKIGDPADWWSQVPRRFVDAQPLRK